MYIILLIGSLLSPIPALAAAALDATSFSSSGTSAATNHNHTFSGTNRLALVCRAVRDISGAVAIDAAAPTINGVSMTHLAGVTHNGNVVRADLYYMLNPPAGSQAVVTSPNAATDRHVTGVVSYSGVAQSSTFNTPKTTAVGLTSADVDIDTLASAVTEVAVMCISQRGSVTFSADATTPISTERIDVAQAGDGNSVTLGLYEEDGAATSIDMRVNSTTSSQVAAVAVSIRAAAETGGGRRSTGAVILP